MPQQSYTFNAGGGKVITLEPTEDASGVRIVVRNTFGHVSLAYVDNETAIDLATYMIIAASDNRQRNPRPAAPDTHNATASGSSRAEGE